MGAERAIPRFVERYVRPRPGDRVLDIGCGTARLAPHLGEVTYIGYEPNGAYVKRALAEQGSRIEVHQGTFDEEAARSLDPVDLVVLSAVLHHLNDAQARSLFSLLSSVLKLDGRVVTIDNSFVDGQHPIARLLIRMDRGLNVRTPEAYAELPAPFFEAVSGEVRHQAWIPYTFWHMECSRPKAPRGAVRAINP